MKVAVNCHAFESHVINPGFLQRSLLGSNYFLLYTNDLLKSKFKSFVDIHTDGTTVCVFTSKILVDQSLTTHLSPGIALTTQRS